MFINGENIELPKYTLEIMDGIEAVNQAPAGRAKFNAMHQFACKMLGNETVADVCDGASLNTVDLSKLNRLYLQIVAEYTRPTIEAQAEQLNEQLQKLAPALEAAAKVAAMQKTRAGFSRVK